ncbi:MAG TPA: hypothetical protein VFQ05_01135 [Candidatus Eisenbacteria bacterium]|nr:hypothetical protein [Candidatus Eisenbacteria bacterium]
MLLADLAEMVARDRASTAELLAYLCEVEGRRLFLSAGYASMYAYCVDELHLSEQAAYKRIYAARLTRRFPAVFSALTEGRIHLAGVCLLGPYLKPGNADELLAMANYQRKSEIERRLALRFPRTELMTIVEVFPGRASSSRADVVPERSNEAAVPANEPLPSRGLQGVAGGAADQPEPPTMRPAFSDVEPQAPPVASANERPKLIPLAPQRFGLQVSIPQSTYDKLQHALALLSHVIPCGDVAQLIDRALDVLIRQVERQKLGAALQPRPLRLGTHSRRYVPAHVRRAVWRRDGGRCTFVSESGHRCDERRFLQFDHIDPVARGGLATVDGIRLRCRAHNQYEAERMFGRRFMMAKRESRGRRIEAGERTREEPAGEVRESDSQESDARTL